MRKKIVCGTPAPKHVKLPDPPGDPTMVSAAEGISSGYSAGMFLKDHQLPVSGDSFADLPKPSIVKGSDSTAKPLSKVQGGVPKHFHGI